MSALDSRERLDALRTSGLLRKDVGARYDQVTYTAARLLRADFAELNVLTDTTQHHLSTWPRGNTETLPAVQTGCQIVVEASDVVEVPDTREHPLMCTMPWATEVRGYLGAPVFFAGQCVGSLCVLTGEPRDWAAHDSLALVGLARLVSESLLEQAAR